MFLALFRWTQPLRSVAFQPWQSAVLLDNGQWWSGELSGQLEPGPLWVAYF